MRAGDYAVYKKGSVHWTDAPEGCTLDRKRSSRTASCSTRNSDRRQRGAGRYATELPLAAPLVDEPGQVREGGRPTTSSIASAIDSSLLSWRASQTICNPTGSAAGSVWIGSEMAH
jgi:hypothetical protein